MNAVHTTLRNRARLTTFALTRWHWCNANPARISHALMVWILGAALLGLSTVVKATAVDAGFSGMWYDPARSGEGLQLEILSADTALVEWFTYDESGKQRWIQGVGTIKNEADVGSVVFPQVYITHGGKFGSAFDADAVEPVEVGSLTLTFGDCASGTFTYSMFGQTQTLPIQRLTQAMGAGCQSINGVVGQPIQSYAGQSGSWYDPNRSGEGFGLQWLANGTALVTWYTYDTRGNQVWLLGVGTELDGAIEFPQMEITKGPKFGTAYDSSDLIAEDWGSLSLRIDCSGGSVHYASTLPEFGSGDMVLTRLTQLQKPACPYVAPKFTDLYDVVWDEIPIEKSTPYNPKRLVPESIANDGTIAAMGGVNNLVLWQPEARLWENIPRELTYGPNAVFISPDGTTVVATDATPDDPYQAISTLVWQRASGWQELAGNAVTRTYASNTSENVQYLVGIGFNPGGPVQPWIRAIDGEQRLLPTSDAIPAADPWAVSNDGRIVIGNATVFVDGWPIGSAMRWVDAAPPSFLRDPQGLALAGARVCDANCAVVFGTGYLLGEGQAIPPHFGEVWYWKADGTFGHLGTIDDAAPTGMSFFAGDATSDGALVVGRYWADKYPAYPDSGSYATRAFVWTQTTGPVSVRALSSELGIGDDEWQEVDTVRLSQDGSKILIFGYRDKNLEQGRGVVLHLTPKT